MLWRVARALPELRRVSITRSAAFALIVTVDIFVSPVRVSCQGPWDCHHQPVDMALPDPQGFVTMLTEGTTCTNNLYNDLETQIVPNGAYLKAGTAVRIDTEAHTTGTCYQYMFDWWNWTCNYSGIAEMQTLHKVDIYCIPPNALTTHTEYGAPYPSRGLDTRGLNIYGTQLSDLGEWKFTFQSEAYGTACTDTMHSSVITKTVNVLQCGPQFATFGLNPLHVAATDIDVYVPDDMYGLWDPVLNAGPLRGAVDDWNNALRDLGLTLHLTTTQCSGGACIRLAHGPMVKSDDCAETGVPPSGSVPSVMTLTDGNQDPFVLPWNQFGEDFQRYMLAHELAHTLGLLHPVEDDECATSEQSVMTSPSVCGAPMTHVSPTINDILPIRKTVFGPGTQTKCGFPIPPPQP